MADEPQTAAQDDEQGASIPGQDDDNPTAGVDLSGGTPVGSPQPQTSSQQPASATSTPPKASGRALFLGNLLKTVLSGAQNVQGNPNNAFDRGFAQNSPQNQKLQQAKVDTAQSEADQAKLQTSITGMKALQTEYLLKRLPVEDQLKHMEVISAFKDTLIKEGASVEAEGDDEKASDAQAMHLNGTDPRALQHSGHFWSLPTMDESGKPKFDVVYVPTKDALQNDFTWKGADGEEHTITAGTPMLGLPKMVEQLQKDVQGDTKSQHRQMADALKPNVPDAEIPQTVGWLKTQKEQNTPLYQQNKNAVDAQINMLQAAHGQIHSEKLAEAKAGAQGKLDVKNEQTEKENAESITHAVDYADRYTKSGAFTGPGDFALTEQYLEAVKVSKGFRMGEPQFRRIDQGRSLIEGARAAWGKGTKGTLFSPEQRQQIVGTMHMMAAAKGASDGKVPARPSNVPANAVWTPETRQWRLPQ